MPENHSVEDWKRLFQNHPPEKPTKPPYAVLGNQITYGILICIGVIAIVGNASVMLSILIVKRLRNSSSAYMFHQCLLDLLKGLYSLILAHSILTEHEPSHCSLLGGMYIVCVTSNAFNILAMIMNDAYVFADLINGHQNSGNYCCVMFGVAATWFAAIILNLGVAFLPGSPTYVREIGHCTFKYGVTRNYVLHTLWTALITLAVGLSIMYLRKLYREIMQWQEHNQMTIQNGIPQIRPGFTADRMRYIRQHCLGKVVLLGLILIAFIMFWYPLFLLTIFDPKFLVAPTMYRIFTVFACFKSAITPWLIAAWAKGGFCCWRTNIPPHFDDVTLTSEEDLLGNANRYSRYLASDDNDSAVLEFRRNSNVKDEGVTDSRSSWTLRKIDV